MIELPTFLVIGGAIALLVFGMAVGALLAINGRPANARGSAGET